MARSPSTPAIAVPDGAPFADRYRIDRLLRRGRNGSVFAATDLHLQRAVALKVASGAPLPGGEFTSHRLLREGRLLASLQHPNVAAIHDHGHSAEGDVFLALELIPGTTLRQFLTHHRCLPWRTSVAVATHVASGLRAAHARGVVHCDLSPSHVMVARTDHGSLSCKLIDFGMASRESDPRLDLRALGVMLTEMLATSPTRIPRALVSLADSLNAADRNARPANAAAVLRRLSRIALAGDDSDARSTPLLWCAVGIAGLLAVGGLASPRPVSTPSSRKALEDALARWLETQSLAPLGRPEIHLDPGERSARIVYSLSDAASPREIVEHWSWRDGRWQRLAE